MTSSSPSVTLNDKKHLIKSEFSPMLSAPSIQILFFIHPSLQGNTSWSLLSSHKLQLTDICPFSLSFWAWHNHKPSLINHSHLITFPPFLSHLYFHPYFYGSPFVLFCVVVSSPQLDKKSWIRWGSHEQHTPTFLVLLWLTLEPTQATHTRMPPPPLPSFINIELI